MGERPSTHTPVTFDSCAHIEGPFYHGTKSALEAGAELVPGYGSNFQPGRVSNNIYFTALVETAAWGAELATAPAGIGERGHIGDGRTFQLTPKRVPARSHHIAHGTLGIVYALASVGDAVGRDAMVELALAGAADVVSRNEAGQEGFLVPHSDPPHRPDLIERYSYGWCNGPAGDAQVFRLLARITGDDAWTALEDRCWRTIRRSGLPRRIRPGFWDNNGRCCGTAGVLAYACDRIVERGDDFSFSNELVDDLTARATVDAAGVRWGNVEHRATPRDLEPQSGWAMGNAGIIRELLRYARISIGGETGYAIPWPDHPATSSSCPDARSTTRA